MKPYAKAQTVRLEGMEDRRRRLTEAQKDDIRERYAQGDIGMRPLARMFGVSRDLVRIIVDPRRAERVKARFKAHWRDYSRKRSKATHAAAIRKTRNYKYKLYMEKAKSTPLDTTAKDMV